MPYYCVGITSNSKNSTNYKRDVDRNMSRSTEIIVAASQGINSSVK